MTSVAFSGKLFNIKLVWIVAVFFVGSKPKMNTFKVALIDPLVDDSASIDISEKTTQWEEDT
jgi:hypothetical protein